MSAETCQICWLEESSDPADYGEKCLRRKMGTPGTAALLCYQTGYGRVRVAMEKIAVEMEARAGEIRSGWVRLGRDIAAYAPLIRSVLAPPHRCVCGFTGPGSEGSGTHACRAKTTGNGPIILSTRLP